MDERFSVAQFYDCESVWGFAMPVPEDPNRCAAGTRWLVKSKPYWVQCRRDRVDGRYCIQHANIARAADSARRA